MARYASTTKVSVEKSKGDIDKALRRYGADGFMSFWCRKTYREGVSFDYNGLRVAVSMRAEPEESEQQRRQRWRALLLVIKAKLEAVDSGISTFEQEFLAWVCDNKGSTIGERIIPQLPAFAQGRLALPAPKDVSK